MRTPLLAVLAVAAARVGRPRLHAGGAEVSAVARVRLPRPLGAAVAVAGAFALAAAEGDSVAAALDGGTRIANCCGEAVWSPDGRDIAFTGGRGDVFIVRVDGTGLRRVAPAPDQAYQDSGDRRRLSPVWPADSSRLAFSEWLEFDYPPHAAWRVQSVARAGGAVRTEHPNASFPSWSPGGRFLAVADGEREGYPGDPLERSITLIDLAGRTQRVLVRASCLGSQVQGGYQPRYPGCPEAPQWSPAGGLVAYVKPQYVRGRDEPFEPDHAVLRVIRTDGTRDRPLARTACDTCFSWAPDGRRIAFMTRAGRLAIVNVHTGATRRTQVALDGKPLWSPAGGHIALPISRDRARTGCLAVASFPALRVRTLLCRPSRSLSVAHSWAPDGRRLAIGVPGGILVVRADTGATRLVRPGAAP